MPVPATGRQIRWAFSAEARGELPKGTARRWAKETKRFNRQRHSRQRRHFKRMAKRPVTRRR